MANLKAIRWLPAVVTSLALAQQPPVPRETPSPQTVDPAVNTSVTPAAVPTATPATKPARKAEETTQPSAKTGKSVAKDRLELDTTQITGNRELPKVLYIVPWRRSDLGDLPGRPVNSLLDEVLAPVDRDVFKRENRYYTALKPDAAAGAAPAAQGQEPNTK